MMEEKKMNGWQKLMKVQTSMSVSKDKNGGRFWYYDIGNILAEAKPHLAAVGAVITMTDKVEEKDGKMLLTSTATFVDADTGETVTQVESIMEHIRRDKMDASQSMGSTSTYARKRALAGLLLVDGEEDPDAAGAKKQAQQTQRPQAQRRAQQPPQNSPRVTVWNMLTNAGIDPRDFAKVGYNANFEEISSQNLQAISQNLSYYIGEYRKLKEAQEKAQNEEIPL